MAVVLLLSFQSPWIYSIIKIDFLQPCAHTYFMIESVATLQHQLAKCGINVCHVYVVPEGYFVQTSHRSVIHSKTLPFDFEVKGIDKVRAEFVSKYDDIEDKFKAAPKKKKKVAKKAGKNVGGGDRDSSDTSE